MGEIAKRPCARLALHADVGPDPGVAADRHPAVSARVADLGGKKAAGTLQRPSFGELFCPELRRTTIVTTIMFAVQLRRGVRRDPADSADRAGRAGSEGGDRRQAVPEEAASRRRASACVGKIQELGGLMGRFLLAFLAVRIVSRRVAAAGVPGAGPDPRAADLRVRAAARA